MRAICCPVAQCSGEKYGVFRWTFVCSFLAFKVHVDRSSLGEAFPFSFPQAFPSSGEGGGGQAKKNNPIGKIQIASAVIQCVKFCKSTKSTATEFSLAEIFCVELSNGEALQAVMQEDAIIKALYTDSSFYAIIGNEFCLLFDIMYAKTGTEAVAESFYRVVEKKEMEGGQSLPVLASCAKIDWCFPSCHVWCSPMPPSQTLHVFILKVIDSAVLKKIMFRCIGINDQ